MGKAINVRTNTLSLKHALWDYLDLTAFGLGMQRSKLIERMLAEAIEANDARHQQARDAMIDPDSRKKLDKLREQFLGLVQTR